MADMEAILDEDRPQETPASIAELDPSDPALIVFTSGTTGEPRAALHTASYLPAQRGQAENWVGSNKKDLVWVTTATGLVEVGPERVRRALADGRRGAHLRRAVRPGGAPRALRAGRRDRPLSGADRVPDARGEGRASPDAGATASHLSGRAAGRGHARGLPRRLGTRGGRRLRPDRDGPRLRKPPRRRGEAGFDGPAAPRGRGPHRRRRASGPRRDVPHLLRGIPGRRGAPTWSTASGGRPETSSAKTKTGTSSTRAEPTT